MSYIYRLVAGPDPINVSARLPAGFSYTGFWSTSKTETENLINAHLEFVSDYMGGGAYPWSDELTVLTTDLSNVETVDEYEKYRTGPYQPDFDSSEIFVIKIKDLSKITKEPWDFWKYGRKFYFHRDDDPQTEARLKTYEKIKELSLKEDLSENDINSLNLSLRELRALEQQNLDLAVAHPDKNQKEKSLYVAEDNKENNDRLEQLINRLIQNKNNISKAFLHEKFQKTLSAEDIEKKAIYFYFLCKTSFLKRS
jgi:hypothetical protein